MMMINTMIIMLMRQTAIWINCMTNGLIHVYITCPTTRQPARATECLTNSKFLPVHAHLHTDHTGKFHARSFRLVHGGRLSGRQLADCRSVSCTSWRHVVRIRLGPGRLLQRNAYADTDGETFQVSLTSQRVLMFDPKTSPTFCPTIHDPNIQHHNITTICCSVMFAASLPSSHRLSKDQSGYNFDFRLLYKVLPRETAVVRFGGIRREGKWHVLGM